MKPHEENRHGLDCLLVHTPKFQTYYPPLNVYQSCNRMAIGLLALADLASRRGYATRVLHLGIETIRDPSFRFRDWLRARRPRVIGFSLHFHHGLVDTFRMVREARAERPDALIFLGGFTATFFQEEIMTRFPEIDVVVAGDAERPLELLLERFLRKASRDFSGIPNVRWRREGTVIAEPQDYGTDEAMLNELHYTNFSLLEHGADYRGMPKAHLRTHLPRKIDAAVNRKLGADRSRTFWGLPVGRGCVSQCFYCGGGAKAQHRIARRHGVIFRRPEQVINSIRDLQAFGFSGSYVSFDPHPWSEAYYIDLFRRMRAEKVRFDLTFSAWGLPSDAFLDAFAGCLGPGSSFLISPETGSEALRERLRSKAYTNDALLDALARADRRGIRTTTFFCIGVPGETPAEFDETLALKRRISARFRKASCEAFLIEVEPGSPWHLDPERYGIRLFRRTLDDFLRDHASARYSSMTSLGYTSAFFGDPDLSEEAFGRKLLALRCRHFCDQRLSCMALCAAWGVFRWVGLAPTARDQALDAHPAGEASP